MAKAQSTDALATIDIVELAARLGVQVGRERNGEAKALCPFHKEATPSFALYQAKAGARSHYHCFGCQAHGGAVDLVRSLAERRTFRDAGVWLEENGFLPNGAFTGLRGRGAPELSALEQILERAKAKQSSTLLRSFAESRRFDLAVLQAADIFVGDLGPVVAAVSPDSPLGLDLVEEGLARRASLALLNQEAGPDGLRATIRGQRVFIPVRDRGGELVGLAARAIRTTDTPKYQLPTGFERGRHLYGLDAARDGLSSGESPVDLYLVEGVFDVLRLRSLGLAAVALLGVQITETQIDLVKVLAGECADAGRILRLHVFLDSDAAGRTATARILPRILAASAAARTPFLIDVISSPDEPDKGKDPDSLLAGMAKATAEPQLRKWARPALDVIAAQAAGLPVEAAREAWVALPWSAQFQAAQTVARNLSGLDIGWAAIQRRLRPDIVSFDGPAEQSGTTDAFIELFSALVDGRDAKSEIRVPELVAADGEDYPARLMAAIELARESASSREYPVDVAAWDRLMDTAVVFAPVLRSRLDRRDGPSQPFTAHLLPRSNGKPRLKCGPSPEDAALQQYVLGELLRPHSSNTYLRAIPAVRWWPSTRQVLTTGRGDGDASSVSFAYQVDMEALESRPDRSRRRDMFRPFIDCWNAYIAFAGRRISRMRGDMVHVARLDISRFYDELPRSVVQTKLRAALHQAMSSSGVRPASLFAPEITEPATRAEALTDWLLAHSLGDPELGYAYADPRTGTPRRRDVYSKGLPQGPALSAYLANIALFDLDQTMADEVAVLDEAHSGLKGYGALYARYVDDIILAAPSEAALRGLVARVEASVHALGLRLNEKSELLLPKSKAEAREWLVDRRGAGFMDYGDAETAPTPVLDGPTSWGDAPDLDRRAALHIILDATLDDPEATTGARLRDVLSRAAQGADTPHGDFGHVARRIWLRAILEDVEDTGLAGEFPESRLERLADGFLEIWRTVVPAGRFEPAPADDVDTRALNESLEAIAILDGAERLLMGAPDRNPTLTRAGRDRIVPARLTFLSAVAAGLLGTVIDKVLGPHRGLRCQLIQSRIFLEARAAGLLRVEKSRLPSRPVGTLPQIEEVPGLESARLGQLALFDPLGANKILKIIGTALKSPSDPAVAGRLLNAGVAYLQAVSRFQGVDGQVEKQINLLELEARDMLLDQIAVEAFPAPNEAAVVLATLRVWLADLADEREEGVANAIIGFILILRAGSQALEPLMARRPLVQKFLGGEDMKPIAQPALPNLPGLLFCKDGQVCAVLLDVDAQNEAENVLPPGFSWVLSEAEPNRLYARYSAELGTAVFVESEAEGLSSPAVARLLRAFYDRLRSQVDAESTPITSAYSLMTTAGVDHVEGPEDTRILAWRVSPERIRDLAFPIRGRSVGIERLAQSEGDWLWRLGRAFNDLFGTLTVVAGESADMQPMPVPTRLEVALRRSVLSQFSGPRLRHQGFNSALRAGELPHRLRRGLEALETVPTTGATPAIWLHFLEGRLMSERLRHSPAFAETPGGPAHLLAATGRRVLLATDDLTGLSCDGSVADHDFGHDVQAWEAVAGAIDRLAADVRGPNAAQLAIIGTGTHLQALTLGFRDLALALLARLASQDREFIQFARPEIAAWDFGGEAVLIRPAFGVQEAKRGDFDIQTQISELFEALGDVISRDRRVVVEQTTWRITLLGWVVAVGVLTGALPTRFSHLGEERSVRPSLPQLPAASGAPEALADFAQRLLNLSSGFLDPEPHWPWGLFESVDSRIWLTGREVLAITLRDSGLRFLRRRETSRFLTQDLGGAVRIQDPEFGELLLQPFQYVVNGLQREARREAEVRILDSQEALQVWAGVAERDNSRPLLVTRLTENLADRRDRLVSDADSKAKAASASDESPEAPSPKPRSDVAPEASRPPEPKTRATDHSQQSAPEVQDALGMARLDALRIRQHETWRARGGQATPGEDPNAGRHMARIAYLQIDFAESYEDPVEAPFIHGDGRLEAKALRWEPGDGSRAQLCPEEWRRRQVLDRIVDACTAFRVDILVLPEYSMRPETVIWLARKLDDAQSTLSVWAGTFRVPSRFDIAVDVDAFVASHRRADAQPIPGRQTWQRLQAIAPVIFRESIPADQAATPDSEAGLMSHRLNNRIHFRPKRYPAIAFHEVFRPAESASLRPLMDFSRSPWRAESFVFELICSEVFAFNGPMNFTSISMQLAKLRVSFGIDTNFSSALASAKKQINTDGEIFSDWVSHDFKRGNWPRRSILIAPCITRRDVDYHVLGLTAHLSAGVATIFCNSVVRGYSNGGSCLIGFGGWETKARDVGAIEGPYHGAVPGVFAPQVPGVDPLGDAELALVIVDVDPEHPTQVNPRPQYRGDPARLVAHLPVVCVGTDKDRYVGWRGCASRAALAGLVEQTLLLLEGDQPTSTFMAGGASATSLNTKAAEICNDLAKLVPKSPGLRARAKAFRKSAVDKPELWPPPALMDWIAVDVQGSTFAAVVAELSNGDPLRPNASLPWIWIEPPDEV